MIKCQRLSLDEREIIGQLLSQGKTLRFFAESLGINVSTISREVGHFPPAGIDINHGWLIIVLIIFLVVIIPAER